MARRVPRPWDEAYRTQGRLWRGARLDPLTARFLDEHPETVRGRWFDAGCGDGKGLVPLSTRLAAGGATVVGADRSVWGLRLAQRALHEARAAAALVRGDARAWPLRAASMDVVRAVHLVGHLLAPERPRAVAALARLLRPGGSLLVSEFGTGDFRYGHGDEVEPGTFVRGVGVRTHYFSGPELAALVGEAGLEVVDLSAQRFDVDYDGASRARERWDLLARR